MFKTIVAFVTAGMVLAIQIPARANDLYCIIENGAQIISVFPLDKAHVKQCRLATESAQKANGQGDSFRLACHAPDTTPAAQVQIGGMNDDTGVIVTGCQ